MTPNSKQFLSTLFFSLSILFNFPAPATPQECPYPCYPPPTGTGNNPQTPTSTALTPPSQTGYYYPPPAAFVYPPPSGYFPYSPPSAFGSSPPPPDSIVPWFPYYSRKPPFQSVDQSSSNAVRRSAIVIVVTHFLCFLIFLSVL
ncbi:hypothetical protein RHGRI_026206 [Rhododendron griersonianum]|uniref:Uncharacterized protein n=1 Tax=Rhododendron griersonianum TaxID=479676 RepID=A0AAV6IS17_9ERIC|nr:hypothetical protein RHGRI_026206 [Rhododendron griersonianum]